MPSGRRVSAFQRLALWTTATTYLLILVGGLVRASGAGLGCPDWPRCFGSWIPPRSAADLPPQFDPAQFNPALMWTEYLNRLLGIAVGFLVLATLASAVRHHRRTRHILWPAAAAFILVGFEGWLGGVVVKQELAVWIVTAHLVVALVIVSLLLYATVYALVAEDRARPAAGHHRGPLAWSAFALLALTLAQVAIGAQVRGDVDDELTRGTPREVVLANIGVMDAWHRDGALVVLGGVAMVLLVIWTRHAEEGVLVRTALLILGLALAQIGLGLSMTYITVTPPAQVAHLTAASLLLGAETVLFLLARWLPEPR